MTTSPKSGKWKDALLKSSLPLEYLVADKMRAKRCGIMGEYSYLRKNEQGLDIECSADIWAVRHYFKNRSDLWGTLNYLVECKYCHPSVKWIFMRHGDDDNEHLIEMSPMQVMHHLCTRMIWDRTPLWNLRKRFPLCPKGVELHNTEATSQNIDRGRAQLVYGLPRLIIHCAETEMMTWDDVDLEVEMFCPILVTTAPLFILKPGLSLEAFRNADDITAVADSAPALVLTTSYSHVFSDYVVDLIDSTHKKNPEIKKRLKELRDLSGQTAAFPDEPSNYSFDFFIRECAYRVLVVNLEHLEETVDVLHRTVLRAAKSLQRVGVLRNDMTQHKTWIEAPGKKTGSSQQEN